MKLVFLGSPAFAVPSLERLAESGHEIAAVITQPDRPKGRGQRLGAPPVKEAAERLGLPVYQPERIREAQTVALLAALEPRAMVVVGYGQIIPQEVIDLAPLGIINVHASLLPKYRGAAPIQWAIARGETVTGVTTMRIDAGLDTGDILLQRETPIGPEETAIELSERLAVMGAELLIETLRGLEAGTIVPRPQDHTQASYAPLLTKQDGRIDWSRPAQDIYNQIRGFVPWPGAWTMFRGKLLHIWRARRAGAGGGPPGSLRREANRLMVVCGDGALLELLEVQIEGKSRISAQDFVHGYRPSAGEQLGEVA
ncbi:MAG TPA: methionyl-tRNA formyltransferase [Bryobacteraceae bacterium]|nr:methionyl-tRNA formyltransferase [Bryobacteraceae bacterium]